MDEELGTATVVYEHPDEGTVERSLENENVAYFQDHWICKIDERDGEDVVRRIPAERVYYVDRTVEAFEDEVATLRNQVESFADDLRETLLGGGTDGDDREATDDEATDEPVTVDVTEAERDGR
ncbi:hypothetical protein [Haloglomus salinum]|jgi:hypothetical protein|uniref:hypothetical protein n=1 Tax=Haloglomus salinum TaxID=2962673 RepID=UPI0020C9CC5A|nr:hypothetical protein [Haloglomus salinum]